MINCNICNCELSRNIKQIKSHISGKKHKKNLFKHKLIQDPLESIYNQLIYEETERAIDNNEYAKKCFKQELEKKCEKDNNIAYNFQKEISDNLQEDIQLQYILELSEKEN